jgi:outer membrane protein
MKQIVLAIATVLMTVTLNAQMKIAHVNSQSLLDSLPSYLKAESDLKKFQDKIIIKYESEIKELNKEIRNLQEIITQKDSERSDNKIEMISITNNNKLLNTEMKNLKSFILDLRKTVVDSNIDLSEKGQIISTKIKSHPL